ncbi:putative cell wall-binding protein [Georgenia soli]|uniref:Putative cell wall-binding protein n=1 Tax=Georgenia soli TaxID=638953 RepID=A0A2A9EJG9_9MICO|nr:cell wall-binding repeat-containing protein [Georgenia soli]PFG38671.1 putative cell wall-binding protein [Georgenia soli]
MEHRGLLKGQGIVARGWRVGVVTAAAVTLALGPAGAASGLPPTANEPPSPAAPVPGADVSDALTVEGASGAVVEPNFSATDGPEAPEEVAPTLWWRWTAPSSGTYDFHTHGSEVDTVLTVSQEATNGLTAVASNDNAGSVVTSEVSFQAEAGASYVMEVEAKDGDAGLVTLGWTGDEAALSSTQAEAPASAQLVAPSSIPVTMNTGEKPQSKLWSYDGRWWAVLPSTADSQPGTWLWRYDATAKAWTNVLRLAETTTAQADTKRVGAVTHVLLHGTSPVLISLEYDSVKKTYKPWSGRPNPTSINLPASETATIDIDSTGRMWVAYDNGTNVEVRSAPKPYSTFSGPEVLARDIDPDDIAVVTAMPKLNRIGVFWSNQATKRFVFRTHADGAAAGTWTAAEYPGSAAAKDTVGHGLADDHLNVAVASNGTLYAAVKTGYDTVGEPVIGLFVRRPTGSWDNLRQVDGIGTRGIVQLDETAGKVRVIYTAANDGADILYKEASTSDLSFAGSARTLIAGNYNNATSTKENVNGALMVMAASGTGVSPMVARWGSIGTVLAPQPDPQPQPEPQTKTVDRWAGADRYAVSANVSARNFKPGVAVAYVANGLTSADALSGAPVAGADKAPVLLTRAGSLPAEVAAELGRLKPQRIVILGGPGAVSSGVAQQLDRYTTGAVQRWAGSDRFETSAAIARANYKEPGIDVAYVANGLTSVDALSAAPVAGMKDAPVLLTRSDTLPRAVAAELDRLNPKKIVILGGTGAVSSSVQRQLDGYTGPVERWSGADRYAVSVSVSRTNFPNGSPVVYVANGLTSVDALSAAPVAGMKKGPVLLTQAGALPTAVQAELKRLNPSQVVILGGTGAVSTTVQNQIRTTIGAR